jgi:hypothetical protein
VGFVVNPEELTLTKVKELKLDEKSELIQKVAETASKEFQIETSLNNMIESWEGVELQLEAYRETGTSILKGFDEYQALLDEQITMTQAMSFRYYTLYTLLCFTIHYDLLYSTLYTMIYCAVLYLTNRPCVLSVRSRALSRSGSRSGTTN